MAETSLSLADAPTLDALSIAVIETPEQYVTVAEQIKVVARYEKNVKAYFRGTDDKPGPLTLQYRAYESLLEKEKEALAPAKVDRALCDKLLIEWDDKQAAIAAEAQRVAEEKARKDAETRQIEEAAALETLALETCDGSLMDEAEALLDQPVIPDPVNIVKATPKVAGVSLSDHWKSNRAVWNQQRDLKLLCAAVLGITDQKVIVKLKVNASLVNFLTPNWQALDLQARASKGTAQIPGVTFFNDRGTSARTK